MANGSAVTAREQARDAAKDRFYDSKRAVNPDAATAHVCNVAADAASDVWEPILRDLVAAIHVCDDGTATFEALQRAEEALG